MRLTVRLNEVRAPLAPIDTLSPSAVQAIDSASATLDAHYNGVLTQLKNLLGTASWRDQPLASVTSLASFQSAAQSTLQSQAQAQVQQSQQLQSQALSIQVLIGAAQSVTALKAQIDDLQTALSELTDTEDGAVASLAKQLGQMDGALSQSLATLSLQVSIVSSQLATDAARIAALETQAQDFVTQTYLTQAFIHAYAVDQIMLGLKNAQNLLFVAPSAFVPQTLRVALNGQILRQGTDGDYIVQLGANGALYDTIELVHQDGAPCAQDLLTATYIPATTP